MGAEAAFGHVHAVAAQEGGYLLIQRFGLFGAGGLAEGGAAAVAGVAVEGELRYQQHFAAGVFHRQIEFAGFVFKDAQVGDFVGDIAGVCLAVFAAHAKQHAQAVGNLAERCIRRVGGGDVGMADFLDNGTHGFR